MTPTFNEIMVSKMSFANHNFPVNFVSSEFYTFNFKFILGCL